VLSFLAVAVNLSARSVGDPLLPEFVSAALLSAGVPADRLVLEITESSVMRDFDKAVPILARVAAIGVTLSLDDFGTGYSSLSYVHRLPVGEIKIDRSFVTGLHDPGPGRASSSAVLVKTVLSLGTSLGLRVVAEGVEDEATLDMLNELGCDFAQGYFISPPSEAAAIVRLVATHAETSRRRPPAVSLVRPSTVNSAVG